jgi:hypothetical protein
MPHYRQCLDCQSQSDLTGSFRSKLMENIVTWKGTGKILRRRIPQSRSWPAFGRSKSRSRSRVITAGPRSTAVCSSIRPDDDALTRDIIRLASQYGRNGYRRITALLQEEGWMISRDRVQRSWRREGLKVPKGHKPRGRLWLNDGTCIRLRPEHVNPVLSYDFASKKTPDGCKLWLLTRID